MGEGTGLTLPHREVFTRNPELIIVAVLLVAMACGSRGFSQAIHVGPVYVTEATLGLAGVVALLRRGFSESRRLLERLPILALGLIWVVGAIAIVRGLRDFGFSLVEDDIGLIDYSLLLALFALVLVDRERYRAMFATLVLCGFVGVATFLATFTADQITGEADSLIQLQGQAAGLYMSFAVIWVAARLVHGVPTPRWLAALVPGGLVLMALTSQRSVWLIAILGLGAVVLLAPRGARLRNSFALGAVMVFAFVGAIAIEAALNATVGGVESRTTTTAAEGGDTGGGPQLVQEFSSLGGGDSAQADNVTWRIAYWKEIVSRTPSNPLLGVGFGKPAAFTWEDRKYDFRDRDPGTGLDVAGPHNSFVSWLYRLGIPAALALLFVLFVAARNVWRALHEDELATGERVTLVTLVGMLGSGIGVSSFNESLTGPFLGLFFWAPLAMLLLWPHVRRTGAGVSADAPRPAAG